MFVGKTQTSHLHDGAIVAQSSAYILDPVVTVVVAVVAATATGVATAVFIILTVLVLFVFIVFSFRFSRILIDV